MSVLTVVYRCTFSYIKTILDVRSQIHSIASVRNDTPMDAHTTHVLLTCVCECAAVIVSCRYSFHFPTPSNSRCGTTGDIDHVPLVCSPIIYARSICPLNDHVTTIYHRNAPQRGDVCTCLFKCVQTHDFLPANH